MKAIGLCRICRNFVQLLEVPADKGTKLGYYNHSRRYWTGTNQRVVERCPQSRADCPPELVEHSL
jgi:hypothetical protein